MKIIKIKEAATIIGVSTRTLQRWDRVGTLKAMRYPSGYVYYTDEQIETFLKEGVSRANERSKPTL